MTKKKILIIGSGAKEYALAKKLLDDSREIIVAPGNERISEIATCIDIRENSIQELLEYVLENAIDLTIVLSDVAIKNNIAETFQANGQLIFSPSAKAAEFTTSRSLGKKFMYKLHIPTPRFGVFDKINMAVDYLKTANMPQVIRTDEISNSADRLVCTTFSSAKTFVEDLFCKNENKIVLEDFVFGHEFTFYVITDGYKALPLASVANYKFMEDGDGGILTSGVGAFTPDYKISKNIENSIMQNVVYRVLESLQKKDTPYLGILGIDCVLKDDGTLVVLDFKPYLSDHDSQAVLNLVEDDLPRLFEACAVGSFADDYSALNISGNASIACVLSSRQAGQIIKNIDLVDSDITPFNIRKNEYLELETIEGKSLVLTATATTLSRARKMLYDDVELVDFNSKKYRTDICENVDKF